MRRRTLVDGPGGSASGAVDSRLKRAGLVGRAASPCCYRRVLAAVSRVITRLTAVGGGAHSGRWASRCWVRWRWTVMVRWGGGIGWCWRCWRCGRVRRWTRAVGGGVVGGDAAAVVEQGGAGVCDAAAAGVGVRGDRDDPAWLPVDGARRGGGRPPFRAARGPGPRAARRRGGGSGFVHAGRGVGVVAGAGAGRAGGLGAGACGGGPVGGAALGCGGAAVGGGVGRRAP